MKTPWLLWLACIAIGGCAQVGPYRTEPKAAFDNDEPPYVNVKNLCKKTPSCDDDAYILVKGQYGEDDIPIGIIEFDDQGDLQRRDAKEQIMATIRKQTRDHATLVVVFAHGWLNNASAENDNLANFQKLLRRISRDDHEVCKGHGCASRRVVGVYLAWRGMSATVPLFKQLSFWNRKTRAERIGQDGATEVIADLAKIKAIPRKPKEGDNGLILIGHSFGGALIFSATQQLLMEDAARQNRRWSEVSEGDDDDATASPEECEPDLKHPERRSPKWACKYQSVNRNNATLVILVNPAFEAARLTALHDKAASMHFPTKQSPILAIFTSESDNATKLAFPLGRWLSTLFTTYNTAVHPDQAELDRTAVGHYAKYLTHTLTLKPAATAAPGDAALAPLVEAVCTWESYRSAQPLEATAASGDDMQWRLGSVVLRRKAAAARADQRMNPFYNVAVDDAIISGHSGIWEPEHFMKFISLFVAVQDRDCKHLEYASR